MTNVFLFPCKKVITIMNQVSKYCDLKYLYCIYVLWNVFFSILLKWNIKAIFEKNKSSHLVTLGCGQVEYFFSSEETLLVGCTKVFSARI